MPRRRRRHVAEHDIGRPTERLSHPVGSRRIAEITGEQGRARHRVGRQQVDADDLGAARDRDLGPAARRAAEIDDPPARLQQMEAVVELDQLEGGARAVAKAVRLGDIGVVQLAGQPLGRGGLAPARLSDANRELPAAAASDARH